ncbi:MAG TPA: TRAM domain-containing protein [Kofleriaceae bacterium]|nr:TRAM domain-containing protein [Kofleriaceae bacterium]
MIVEITALAAGGDGIGRDDTGRVTFVPLTAPGDRVQIRIVKQTKSFARGEVEEIKTASPDRVAPPCPAFVAGCGGCQWQHVAMPAQLAAKHAIVTNALRKVIAKVDPIVAPAPPYGWRRRARFHVEGGAIGLYKTASHQVVALAACPQLEPALDRVLGLLAAMAKHTPIPDGELALLAGHRGDVALAFERPWRAAATLVGKETIAGVIADDRSYGTPVLEVEPGLFGSPLDFAQASAAGNAALIAVAKELLGPGPGDVLELYAGGGNLTRAFAADGWQVTPSDAFEPARPPPRFITGSAERVLASYQGKPAAIVLDPPRAGAAEAIDGIVRIAPSTIVYVSCDPATLARDAERLIAAGYRAERAVPVDLMPQTSHVEVALLLRR